MADIPLFCFVHIPRTGGTSLVSWLNQIYPRYYDRHLRREVNPVLLAKKGHRMKCVDAPSGWGLYDTAFKTYFAEVRETPAKVIGGHLVYGLHARLPDTAVQYLTILRDPVARVLSLFDVVRQRPRTIWEGQEIGDPIAHDWYARTALNLEALLAEGEYRLCNEQTRMLTGGSEDPEQAIALLQERYWWTTTDQLAAFPAWLQQQGIGQGQSMPYINTIEQKTKGRKPFERTIPTPELIAAIEAANTADMAIWRWAQTASLAEV